MKYLKTPHEKKSAVLTFLIALLLLLLFSIIGLKYFDPPISYGMEVNFGTSNVGKGKQPVPTPPVSQPKQIPKKSEPVPVEPKSEKVTTKVLTQKESSSR